MTNIFLKILFSVILTSCTVYSRDFLTYPQVLKNGAELSDTQIRIKGYLIKVRGDYILKQHHYSSITTADENVIFINISPKWQESEQEIKLLNEHLNSYVIIEGVYHLPKNHYPKVISKPDGDDEIVICLHCSNAPSLRLTKINAFRDH